MRTEQHPTRPGQAVTDGTRTGITTEHPVKAGNKATGVWQKITVIWLGGNYQTAANAADLTVIPDAHIVSAGED